MARKPRNRQASPEGPPPPGAKASRAGSRIGVAGMVAAVLLGAALAWRHWRPAAEVRREAGQNVLLITVDTLRSDAVGAYGNARAQTPWMDRLAALGARFAAAHAQNVVTLPSHANILSGRYPLDHGVRDNTGFRFPKDADTLATLLKARGYRTGAFVSAFPLDSRFGLDRGFDVYEDSFVNEDTRPAFLEQQRPGPQTVALARRWLEAQGQGPWFCWVHVYEPHFPYDPPEPFASRFAGDPYHGDVAAADAALGPLLGPLLDAGASGRTLVVLTADHGESLGEHGESTHGIFAYEATLHVPLVLFAPRLIGPRVVAEPVRHVDLLPTILDALGLPAPGGLAGRSALGLAEGVPGGVEATYFEALAGSLNRGWAPLHGLLRGSVKYLELPIPELYDLTQDPHESRNLAASRPELLEHMHEMLGRLRAADRGVERGAESAETRERLRALGYVSAAAAPTKTAYTEDDDPKRLIALDALLQEAVGLYAAGKLEEALTRCEELVRRRPSMTLSLIHLAVLRRELGDLRGAVEALRRALALNAEDTDALSLLGAYLNEMGRAKETVALLEPQARRKEPDVDVLIAFGIGLAQVGRTQEALAAFARAREIDPSNAMVLVNVGTVYLMSRDHVRAREAFEAALAMNPTVARAYNSLGVIAAESGRADEAIARWTKSVELNPREYDTLYNLGLLLWKRGRQDEARPLLERFAQTAPRALYARDIERVRSMLGSSGS